MTQPTAPIELLGTATALPTRRVDVGPVLTELAGVCDVVTDLEQVANASRDWWPLTMHWALHGAAPQHASAVVRPISTEQVSAVLAVCSANGIPVTAAGAANLLL